MQNYSAYVFSGLANSDQLSQWVDGETPWAARDCSRVPVAFCLRRQPLLSASTPVVGRLLALSGSVGTASAYGGLSRTNSGAHGDDRQLQRLPFAQRLPLRYRSGPTTMPLGLRAREIAPKPGGRGAPQPRVQLPSFGQSARRCDATRGLRFIARVGSESLQVQIRRLF